VHEKNGIFFQDFLGVCSNNCVMSRCGKTFLAIGKQKQEFCRLYLQ